MPKAKTPPKNEVVIDSDPSLMDYPLRDFVSTETAAMILDLRYRSFMSVLADPRIRKFRFGGKCWLILRSSLLEYDTTRIAGRGRPRGRAR